MTDQTPPGAQTASSGLPHDNAGNRLRGIGLVSLAYLSFAILVAVAKWLGNHLPVAEVVWLRFVVHALLSVALLWPQMGPRLFRSRKPGLQALRATMMVTMTGCNFLAIHYLQLAVNSAILFLTPLLVAMFAAWLLRERLDPGRWLAIATGFVGVLIILRPGTDSFHPAMLLTLFGATLYALFGLLTRKIVAHDSPSSTQFIGTLGGVVLAAPFALAQWQMPDGWLQWAMILLLGTVGGIGHYCLASAHRFAPASVITPFMYLQIVYVMIIGYLVFGDIPAATVYLGGLVIIGSGLYLLHKERQIPPKPPDATAPHNPQQTRRSPPPRPTA